MSRTLTLACLTACAAFGLFTASAGASMIPIYANALNSDDGRAQIIKESGDRCGRSGTKAALRVRLGKQTRSCAYRAPVVGRDIDVSVAGRLLSGTPAKLRPRVHLTVALRAGEGGSLQARVFPVQRKLQIVKNRPDGSRKFLAIVKNEPAIRGVNRANRIYLRAINQGAPGTCRIVVRVNGKRLAVVDDERCAELPGRLATVGVGSTRGGKGALASFSKLQVSVPNPF